MSDPIGKERRRFGGFNFSELSPAGWLLTLASFGAMVATGIGAFSYLEQRRGNERGGQDLAAVIAIAAGIATFLVGRGLLALTGFPVWKSPSIASEGQSQAEAAAAAMQRRYARARGWFRVWASLIPLGCGIPLIVSTQVGGQDNQAICLLAAVFLPCIGLAGMILMASDRSRYRRAAAIATWAARNGLDFTEEPAEDDIEWVRGFSSLSGSGDFGGLNLVTGSLNGLQITALDYWFQHHPGRSSPVQRQSLLVLSDFATGIPDFVLQPKAWGSLLSAFAGQRPVEIADLPEFNRRFVLRAGDREDAASRFATGGAEHCLRNAGLSAEVKDGMLAVYQAKKLRPAEGYADLIAYAEDLIKSLE